MEILIILGLFVLGNIPAVILYSWMKKKGRDAAFEGICKNAFVKGIIAAFPIILASFLFTIVEGLIGLKKLDPLIYRAIHTFVTIAFAEEIVKFLVFRNVVKKNNYEYSWFDLTVLMILVGLGFGAIENLIIAIDASPIIMIIRSVLMGHAGYGFITGWYYGKGKKYRNKALQYVGFVISWLLHGLYDFGLSDELEAYNDNLVFIPFLCALISLICIILIIRFVKKRNRDEKYITPVLVTEQKEEL